MAPGIIFWLVKPFCRIFFSLSLISVALVGVWIYMVMKNCLMTYRTHVFMATLIYLKSLNLLCKEEDKSFIKRTEKTHGWDVLFYIFRFLKRIILFTLIVLTGTDWSFFKPYLQGKEKKFLIVFIPLQVLVYLSLVYICKQHIIIPRWEHKPRRSIVRSEPK